MVHFTLFHLKSPKKIIFLTYMFSLCCWPELKASKRSICSHFVSACDSWWCCRHTNPSGSAEYSFGEIKAGCKSCLRTVSCLPLWAGWNLECVNAAVSGMWGNSKLLICAGSISSKDTGIYYRGRCRIYCSCFYCPFNTDSDWICTSSRYHTGSSPIAVKSVAHEETAWSRQLLEMGSETKK